MPRRNHRSERERAAEVADMLGDDYKFTRDPEVEAQRAANRAERRRQASLARQHDPDQWATCIVPDCTYQTRLELVDGIKFPICSLHAVAVWRAVQLHSDDPDVIAARVALEERAAAIQADFDAETAESKVELRKILSAPDTAGDIYFVRIGDLIKVGWSSDLYARVKSYGASAELLAHYPGTRRDEGLLHKQLAPALARGREWFHDADVVRLHIDQAIAKYGTPLIEVRWTEHDGRIRPRRS